MNTDYVKKGLTPNFEEHLKKQHPYWDAFMQYKLSEDSQERRRRNKKCKQKTTLPSSWARRLFGGHSKMAEDGRRPDLQEESYRRLSTGHCKQSITSMLMEAH
jgi:hypothetical protein